MARPVSKQDYSIGDQAQTNIDRGESDTVVATAIAQNRKSPANTPEPTLFHKVKNQKSILALAVSDSKLYAGTQGGELLVRYLIGCVRICQWLTIGRRCGRWKRTSSCSVLSRMRAVSSVSSCPRIINYCYQALGMLLSMQETLLFVALPTLTHLRFGVPRP